MNGPLSSLLPPQVLRLDLSLAWNASVQVPNQRGHRYHEALAARSSLILTWLAILLRATEHTNECLNSRLAPIAKRWATHKKSHQH